MLQASDDFDDLLGPTTGTASAAAAAAAPMAASAASAGRKTCVVFSQLNWLCSNEDTIPGLMPQQQQRWR